MKDGGGEPRWNGAGIVLTLLRRAYRMALKQGVSLPGDQPWHRIREEV
jgi:hypothetical protein